MDKIKRQGATSPRKEKNMRFSRIQEGQYKAENGMIIKSNAGKNIFTARMMKPTFWYIYNEAGERIDGGMTLREAKHIIEKNYT